MQFLDVDVVQRTIADEDADADEEQLRIISQRQDTMTSMLMDLVVDHRTEDPTDRLRKIRELHDHVQDRCRALYKPRQRIAIDERMVKCKGRASFIQYLPAKPVKWGFKVFAACDAANAILFNFEVFTGQMENAGGLAHDTVLRLMDGVLDKGHVLFTDNFYTSSNLAQSLLDRHTYLVGTVRLNRRGVPDLFKTDTKQFERQAPTGTLRYVRDGPVVYQQWKDKRCVSVLSTAHKGHDQVQVTRNRKVNGVYAQVNIPQPLSIADYNKSMGGVDLFDQHIAAYRTLRRCKKYWKSLFLDMLDIAATNSYRIFELYRADHPGAIERRRHHRHTSFRANLIRQLANLDIGAPLPKRRYSAPPQAPTPAEVALMHVPKHSPDLKRNCVNC
ncbi:piggyBac transposable element-derived protein 4-like [Sycon ciliatum]|uniref:piggyBac transposable element-derived protein 4-like n=1 Tax=Sycon ciliatum TaxID=27933 RepID=UPI0031F6D2FF